MAVFRGVKGGGLWLLCLPCDFRNSTQQTPSAEENNSHLPVRTDLASWTNAVPPSREICTPTTVIKIHNKKVSL